ncbi:protein C1orf43 homolog [Sitodiplosis mosellana]|uniref:protein C1orf43 homolog n=1 Tax=Sitodiplosis mosellana TaxID=263140 RepID=UPI002444185A|nr:protein C1orf43 homolog [Sitodiplosis mosellana]
MLKVKQFVRENTAPHKMVQELSGVTYILIIGGGALMFVLLFIFAKRQIMRFAIRSRRGPHVPVGHDATKSIKKEIERRLDCIQRIAYEPQLLDDDTSYILQPDSSLPPYYYRLKAVDDIKILEKEIARQDGSVRQPRDSLRAFLLTALAAPIGSSQRLIHQFCDMYEHARHDPSEFSNEEYEAYRRLLLKLLDAAKSLKTFSSSRKSSPSRTPVKKQTKVQSLLDPSRLKPPPTQIGSGGNMLSSNSRINYGLGIQNQRDSLTTTGQSSDQEQSPPQSITLHLDANEIITVSPDSSVI